MSMEGSDKKIEGKALQVLGRFGAFIGTLGTKRKASSRKL